MEFLEQPKWMDDPGMNPEAYENWRADVDIGDDDWDNLDRELDANLQ